MNSKGIFFAFTNICAQFLHSECSLKAKLTYDPSHSPVFFFHFKQVQRWIQLNGEIIWFLERIIIIILKNCIKQLLFQRCFIHLISSDSDLGIGIITIESWNSAFYFSWWLIKLKENQRDKDLCKKIKNNTCCQDYQNLVL